MGSSYSIDTVRQLVCSRSWGTMTVEDVRDVDCRMLADERLHSSYRQLTDLRNVRLCELDRMSIRESAGMPVFDAGVRRAIVADSDVMFGLARMFASYAENSGQTVQVFREMDDAERWLSDAAA